MDKRIDSFRKQVNNALLPLIDGDYVLLDVPNHGNIGDNLIWEGEMAFLKQCNHICLYSANVFNWDESLIKDASVILFHGGGNWGDLYRVCQDHRMYVTSKYLDKRIIVFPQSVWYNDESLLLADCQIVNHHPNITVCLRDKFSYDILSRYIDHSKLLLIPDMAFFVNIPPINYKTNRVLFLDRTDKERRLIKNYPKGFDVKDWPTYPTNRFLYNIWHFIFCLKQVLSIKLQKTSITSWLVDPEYGINRRGGRQRYVKKGVKFFSKYNSIYTTRLHGLILGVIMGKQVYIVDNKYNKCKNFYDTWLADFSNVHIFDETINEL